MDVRSLDPDTRAFALVGMFLQYWALMEEALREAMAKALGLQMVQAVIVASNIQLRDKIHILKTAVSITQFPDPEERERFTKLLQQIADSAHKRNMVAHDLFFPPADGDGVRFLVFKAKGKFSMPETIWTTDQFGDEFVEISRWTTELERLKERLTFSENLTKFLAATLSEPNPAPSAPGALTLLTHPPPGSHTSETSHATPEKEGETPPNPEQ
jgi:hypothetical protein